MPIDVRCPLGYTWLLFFSPHCQPYAVPPISCPGGQWYNFETESCEAGSAGDGVCPPGTDLFGGSPGPNACYTVDPSTLPPCNGTPFPPAPIHVANGVHCPAGYAPPSAVGVQEDGGLCTNGPGCNCLPILELDPAGTPCWDGQYGLQFGWTSGACGNRNSFWVLSGEISPYDCSGCPAFDITHWRYDFGHCACFGPSGFCCDTGHGLWWDPVKRTCTDTCSPNFCPCDPQGKCIDCTLPPCSTARGCVWNHVTCVWDCTDVDCSPGTVFNWRTCTCQPGDTLWLLRNAYGRLLRYTQDDSANLTVDYFDDLDATPTNYPVDTGTCTSPQYFHFAGWIWGVHLRDTDLRLAHSRDHGRTYDVTTIPGDYERILAAPHRGDRIVLLGYRASAWYQRVVQVLADNTPSTSAEVAVSPAFPTTPDGEGALWVEPDGTILLAWKDTDGASHLSRCSVLSMTAAGTWRHA